ncbi:glycosyltransferase family 2 protein [Microbacterium sp.]|uniref:glycosyltransferase family 2 protein n=1 Tax=Microbacterium sp. TaxID=51671 RepID=UPI002B7D2270|nr:glycosyltransferase [Microbacterium sp.]HWL77206.1 glycosyltransferase [Microbacterium sp.]
MNDTPRPTASSPRVEVVVAVHSETRPVERAVASALATRAPVRVTVVAHNLDPAAVRRRLGDLQDDHRVRIVELADGIGSPAGPFNRGIELATGEFVSIIGSDDSFAPGAIDAWLRVADEGGADVVIAPIRRTSGGWGTMPRVRPGRVHHLDGDRDRLFERAAPLGLFRRSTFGALRFTAGLPRGEDQPFGLHLWFSGASVSFDPAAPAYVEHGDQADRITHEPRPLRDDLMFVDAIEADAALSALPLASRRAIAARLARAQLVGGIAARATEAGIGEADREVAAKTVRRLERWAPGFRKILANRDARVLRICLDPAADPAALLAALANRGSFRSPAALVPSSLLRLLHRHAPVRSLIAARLVTRRLARAEASRAG